MTKISLLEMGKIKKRNVRETIISILSKEYPLSIKKIYNKVKREHNLDVTYQAVFKIIKEMVDDNILEKSDKEYKLNITWIKDLENEVDLIKKNYMKDTLEKGVTLQKRINDFIVEVSPKIKDYIAKDDACIVGVSGGGKLFAMALFKYLSREGANVIYEEINWMSMPENKNIFNKIDVKNKKIVLVDSEIYSGATYKVIMEKINKIKNKYQIKDIKFVADKDISGLADYSRIH